MSWIRKEKNILDKKEVSFSIVITVPPGVRGGGGVVKAVGTGSAFMHFNENCETTNVIFQEKPGNISKV